MSAREETKLSICDGKYTIVQESTGRTKVLRYGEEWRDVTGDNVIGWLAYELTAANERIKRLEEERGDWKRCAVNLHKAILSSPGDADFLSYQATEDAIADFESFHFKNPTH